ncbi:hypothetical protein RB195_013770 [Necator americanus]|uniref:Carbohydrate sulfotransferase n=1 Tax=Necator americanus TaxID=51031 RepID=A0ABR1DX40_NECAM
MPVVDLHHQRSQAASLLIHNSPYHDVRIGAPSAVMERLDCTGRKLLRRLLGYFWPVTMKISTQKLMWRPANRLVQRVLRSLPCSSWKKPPGRKRKFWTELVKEDLRTLGVDRQLKRDKIEKVGQSCVQGRHTSAKMRIIASGDDISPPIKSNDGVEELRKQVKEGTYDTYPFLPNTLIQPFFRYKELYKVSPKYSVTTCQIEKTTSLLKDAIFCFLKNPWKFRANGRRISTEQYFTRQCKDEYLAKNYSIVGKSLGRIKFAVLRDPIDRRPKDVDTRCFACRGDLTCFVEAFYKKLQEVYATKNNTYNFEVAHLAPQTWYCNFKEHLDDFIFIRYQKCPSRISAYARELDKIFKMARVPEELRREIYNEILVGRTPHTTRDSGPRHAAERELFNNRTLLDIVLKIYFYDYKVFGFSLPD